MPVRKVQGGYRWGKSGKVYPTEAQAERQGRAIYASGYEDGGITKVNQADDPGIASRIESFLKNIGRGREDPQWKVDLREAVARGEADPGLLAMGVDPLDKAGMLEAAYGPGGFSPAQMLWGAGLLTGAGGIAEAGGKYPEPVDRKASIYEMVTGPRTPSAVENWETGHPWIAGLQTLGAVIPGGAYLKAGSGPVRRGIASIEGNVARFVEPGNAIDEMVRSRLLGDYAGAHLWRSLDAHPMEPPTTLVGQGARATRVADSPDDAKIDVIDEFAKIDEGIGALPISNADEISALRAGESLSEATDRLRIAYEAAPSSARAKKAYLEMRSARDAAGETGGTAVDTGIGSLDVDTSYRMSHQPGPRDPEAIQLDNLSKDISGNQAGYPDDFYSSEGQRLYAQGPRFAGDEYGIANEQSYKAIIGAKGNPEAEVTIYRAVPKGIGTINQGDFVTLSPKYAELHAASGYGRGGDEAGEVISQKVKVKDLLWAGDDVNEFGYAPSNAGQQANIIDEGIGALPRGADEGSSVIARVDDREAAARARQERAQTTSTRRLGTTGQYVGAPRGVTSPQALGRLRSNYIDQVKAGEAGAEWYTDASNWARSVTNSDEEAQQLVDQLAVTSAGANVGTNLGFTVKGLNQAAVGAPVQTGRFPTRQSAQIEAIQGGSRESLGPKITPFADNLSVAWNPRMASQPVHDIWQGRAMGYKDVSVKSYPTRKEALDSITNNKGKVSAAAEIIKDGDVYRIERPWSAGFTDAQHAFMDGEMATIVDMLNAGKVAGKTDWTPAEAQAAAWTGAKIRSGEIKPEDAAQHYGSFASRYTAHATTEQAPGVGTGHLEGFLELPQGQREAFALDPRSSWADESGRDSIYAAVGIPTRTSRENVGAFRPASGGGLETNPGVVARPLVSTRETRNYEVIVDGKPTEVYTVGAAPPKDQTFYLLSDKPEITSEVLTPLPKSRAVIPDEGTKINRLKGAKGEKTGELEPKSRRVLEAGSSLTAYWDVQNAGAAHRLIPDSQNSAGQRTSLNVLLDRKLTTDEVIALDEVAMNNGMFVVDSGRGVRLINDPYSEIGESRARGEITLRKERQGKGKIYDQIINAIDEPADSVKVVPAQIDTAYQDYEDLWSQGVGSGASTSKILDDMDQVPAIRDAVEPAAKRKAAQNLARDAEMAESSGLAVRSDVQEARRIFIAEGFAGLRKALNNGAILPAVAAAVVAPSVLIERNESPQT